VIAHLFDAAKEINKIFDAGATISSADLRELLDVFRLFYEEILGLQVEGGDGKSYEQYRRAVDLLLEVRMQAKQNRDWATSDHIRNELVALGFTVKDTKEGVEWTL